MSVCGVQGLRFLLTAATSGLGLATARVLVAAGADVAISGRSADRLHRALTELGGLAPAHPHTAVGRAVGAVSDLTDPGHASGLPSALAEKLGGPLDGVFVNTGGPAAAPFSRTDDAGWQTGFDLMLMPVVRLCRAAEHITTDQASLVFSTSSVTVEPSLSPDLVVSACIRSAVATLANVLSREWAPRLRVNQIVPGRILTQRVADLDQVRADRSGEDLDQVVNAAVSRIPLKRYGTADEFGNAAAWLLSPASSYVTGSTLTVDGGLLARI